MLTNDVVEFEQSGPDIQHLPNSQFLLVFQHVALSAPDNNGLQR